MNNHADKTQENKSRSVANEASQKLSSCESAFQFVDNRPEAIALRKLQEMANNSHQARRLRAFQEMANYSPQALIQRKPKIERYQGKDDEFVAHVISGQIKPSKVEARGQEPARGIDDVPIYMVLYILIFDEYNVEAHIHELEDKTYYSHIYPKGGREMLVVMKQKEGELVSRTIDVSVKDSAIKKAVELRDDEIERSDQWSWDYRLAPSLKASAPNKK